jgi:uncharacterized protein (DUF1697 family)
MRWIVFLRAANVGKHNRFQPALLAEELARFGFVNVGAVGTFVVREDVSEAALRAALLRKLPFKCEIMICPAKTIVDLAREKPLRGGDVEAYVTIMAKRLKTLPKLPIYAPSEGKWEIKIVRIVGAAVVSLRRKLKNGHLYPNQIIEKKFGVAATTRNWNTIEKLAKILDQGR